MLQTLTIFTSLRAEVPFLFFFYPEVSSTDQLFQTLIEDVIILAIPLSRCMDTPSFDPSFTFHDGHASR